MKSLTNFFRKHGFWKGIGIIRRYLTLKLIYEPIKLKRKLIKINGYKLLLDFETGGISKPLYYMRSREILETEVVKNCLREGDVCLDAGSNIGYYAFLEANKKGTEVYSFEPDKRNTIILKEGIKKNGFKNIKVYDKALSNIVGKQRFYLSEQSNINSMVKGAKDFQLLNGESYLVETDTIDNFFKDKKLDLIRMDVEGFEYEIFSGMDNLIKSKKPLRIMIEFHPFMYSKERDFISKIKLLKENNFKAKYIITSEKPLVELMNGLGYEPEKIVNDSPNVRALYKDVKMDDLIKLLNMGNLIRATLFERE